MYPLPDSIYNLDWVLWATRIGALLGAGVAMLKLWEWWGARPKIKGQIQQVGVNSTVREDDTGKMVTMTRLLLCVYVVNTRPHPTTVRSWELAVQESHRQYPASPVPIPVKGASFDRQIIFQQLRALDVWAKKHVLPYLDGKVGWLCFEAQDVRLPVFKDGTSYVRLILTAIDSVGGRHKLDPYDYEGVMPLDFNVDFES